jgi:hypothetical protein
MNSSAGGLAGQSAFADVTRHEPHVPGYASLIRPTLSELETA